MACFRAARLGDQSERTTSCAYSFFQRRFITEIDLLKAILLAPRNSDYIGGLFSTLNVLALKCYSGRLHTKSPIIWNAYTYF
jgi:hypothetical protein